MTSFFSKVDKVFTFLKSRTGVALILFLLFGSLAMYMWRSYKKYAASAYNANHEKRGIDGESLENGDAKPATIMLFYATWCPACKAAKPVWDKLKDQYDGEIINGYDVIFVEYDCSDRESPEAAAIQEKYGITGYPTIKLKRDNEIIDFEGDRTESTLDEFLHTVL